MKKSEPITRLTREKYIMQNKGANVIKSKLDRFDKRWTIDSETN